jgi:leucyl aminopeptidase
MEVNLKAGRAADVDADLLALPVEQDWKAGITQLRTALRKRLVSEGRRLQFRGHAGQTLLLQTAGTLTARHVLLIGLSDAHVLDTSTGDGDTDENADAGSVGISSGDSAAEGEGAAAPRSWYRVAHACVSRGRDVRAARVAVVLPAKWQSPALVEALTEGALLSAYAFTRLKSKPPADNTPRRFSIVTKRTSTEMRAAMTRGRTAASATCYARELINLPADVVTPSYLAAEARRMARRQQLHVRILDERGIERLGMGALRGVSRGSSQPPRFIELVYEPEGRPRRCIALAGKGITFDSGGLSLKPADSMQSQKRDMSGAAAVLAVMSVIRDLAPPVEVRCYVPSTENMPGGRALKPGDVVRAMNGKTIEVLNTDAEGRLVLADALSYAAAAKPDVLIDLATLTGAVRVCLGTRYAAIMGTQPQLVQDLIAAGNECDERLWQLPLVDEYRSDIFSDVADIKNIGGASGAGTIIGGLFLREFAGGIPWAHIDFSSTAVVEKAFPCHARGAAGFGVRTLLRYLRRLA